MKKIVIIAGAFVLAFLGSLQYLSSSQSIITHNQATLEIAFSWQPKLYAFIFSVQVLAAIILFLKVSPAWKTLTVVLFLNILVGFGISLLVTNWATQYKIDSIVFNKITLNYWSFFSMANLFMVPIVLINAFKLMNHRPWLAKIQLLKSWEVDFRVKRFLGNVADMLICYMIDFLLSRWLYHWTPYSFPIVYFLYKYILEAAIQTTLGKNLFQLYILSSNNQTLRPWRFLVRNCSRIIPLYSVPLLFEKPGLHESISATKVLRVEEGYES